MKKTQVVIMDFLKLNPSDLCDRSDDIVTKLNANVATFATPDYDTTTMQDDTKETRIHIKGALRGDKNEKVLLKDAVKKQKGGMKTNGKYVSKISKGVESVMNLGGYNATKGETTPGKTPDKPKNFVSAPTTIRKVVEMEVDKLDFADDYTFIIGKDLSGVTFNGNAIVIVSATPVTTITSTKKKVTIGDQPSNVLLQCMSFGVNRKAGRGIPSEIITVTPY